MHEYLDFWLFPPQGDHEAAVRKRACTYKDVVEEVIGAGHLTLETAPDYADVDGVARLGIEMAQGTDRFRGAGWLWRDPGLCLIAIATECGDMPNLTLKGLSKGYQGAHPGAAVEFILRHKVANPMAVVDEIDKVAFGSHNGDISQTLLDFLEPATARGWYDECLCTEVDVSNLSWILTANDVSKVPGPLLSRCRTFEIPAPDRSHFDALLRSIRRRLAEEAGCRPEMLPAFDQVEEEALRRSFAKHTTVRSLKSKVERLVGLRARLAPEGVALN